jgi:Uma2 family endonuclease
VPKINFSDLDGRGPGESDWHLGAWVYLLEALRIHYADRADVYVTSKISIYYEKNNPMLVKEPDCMVIFGVPKHERQWFRTWAEGAVPAVVFEITSEETFRVDIDKKHDVYATMGVSEYYVFDPLGTCFDVHLFGYRLRNGAYESMPLETDGGLTSQALAMRLVPEGSLLRLVDLANGRPLPTAQEHVEELNAERQRADALAAEVEQLRALLANREPKSENKTTED